MADSEDTSRPSDMVSAGGTPAPPDTQAMVEALRSMGTPPQAALANIQAPLQQPAPQQYALPLANIGSAIGSGGLAAMAGRPGANPYLQQLDDQQRSLFYQQIHAQQEQDRRTDRAFAQNKTLLTIEKGVLDSLEEGPLKAQLANQYAQRLSQFTGNPLLGGIGSALATKQLSMEQLNGVLADGAQGMDPKLISMKYKISPQKVQEILQVDPKLLERMGADSAEKRKRVLAENRLKQIQSIEAEYPAIKGHPEMIQTMMDAHAKLNMGKSFDEGTDESRRQAYEIAKLKTLDAAAAEEARQDARKLALFGQEAALKEGISSRLQEQKDIAAENRQAARLAATETQKKTAAEEKKKQALVVTKTFLAQYKDYIDRLDEGGFLPKDGSWSEDQRAKARQGNSILPVPGYSQPNADVWRGWLDLQGNFIGFARSVQNDIGPRAMQAFEQAVRVSGHPPTKQGLKQIYKQMEEQVKAAESGEVPAGVGFLQTDPRAVYKQLRDSGLSPQAAAAELKKRGYPVGQ